MFRAWNSAYEEYCDDTKRQIFELAYGGEAGTNELMHKYADLMAQMTQIKSGKTIKRADLIHLGRFLTKKKQQDVELDSENRKVEQFEWVRQKMAPGKVDFFGLQEFDKKMLEALKKTGMNNVVYTEHKKMDVAILYDDEKWQPVNDATSFGNGKKEKQFAIMQTFQCIKKESCFMGKKVTVFSVHLASGAAKKKRALRVKQMKEIKPYLNGDIVVCMDANDTKGPELLNEIEGDDKEISSGSSEDLPNCIPRDNLCTSDHYAVKASLKYFQTLDVAVAQYIGNKGGTSKVSTLKCRGPSSEQFGKIGEWVKGTIDFVLSQGDLSGMTVMSWNLLNKSDGFFKQGDAMNFEVINNNKKFFAMHKNLPQDKLEKLKGLDGHWEQEIVKYTHFCLLKIADKDIESISGKIRNFLGWYEQEPCTLRF